MEEKTVVILGATGSIGTQTVDVIKKISGFKVTGIAFGKNTEIAKKIMTELSVENYYSPTELGFGRRFTSYGDLVAYLEPDIVVSAITGFEGVKATLASIPFTKRLALATKESLVCAGRFVKNLCKKYGVELIPIDSEHSAIFQIIENSVEKIVLTASGGAVRDVPLEKLNSLKAEQVLKHPTWNMGGRITVDSATMVNKLFEVIEANELFGVPFENIDVKINPSSFVHGLVLLKDGTIKIHAGKPDMRVPIAYALTYPERRYENEKPRIEDFDLRLLDVEKERYPLFYFGLQYADSLEHRIALNAADEVAVEKFLAGKIDFKGIELVVKRVVENVDKDNFRIDNIEDVFFLDEISRKKALEEVEKIANS
ncbi:1-deoxy-D-xylulose 5-phosphate reductoisomerase [Fervidobacterium pennivorans DSM 9078]|uniref:1-deoxy-D-xylulose 5-phosphate reductoisomerase n=1 Tax=Fervidobacterium pennivorans (strain DSM 9078 / Ven5) TaxID=771875 RepID=H9UBC6_FERPD|nr:1-deoxy-D-xylulose-5-phosphate reductoisomerase [Fervidobacterium pennivorans]AFG34819.1 1-deoxy-D-xylulose 5-phosphate reductoisomerase [Fervidobacterium pennivorans DSM 9078]